MDVAGLIQLLALGLVVWWALVTGYTAWTLTHPARRTYGWAVARSLPGDPSELRLPGMRAGERIAYESWTFRSRGRDLPVWDIRGGRSDGPTVILTHGWGDSRVVMLNSGRTAALLPRVARLVLWDMPGHGDAPGVCALGAREHLDLLALLEHVRGPGAGGSTSSIVLHGFSLGAVVTLRAAAAARLSDALIIEAPYVQPATPARNVLRLRGLPYRSNLAPALALIRLILPPPPPRGRAWLETDQIAGPVWVLHGDRDAISPPEDGAAIASRLRNGRLVTVPTGEHHTLWTDPEARRVVEPALDEILGAVPV